VTEECKEASPRRPCSRLDQLDYLHAQLAMVSRSTVSGCRGAIGRSAWSWLNGLWAFRVPNGVCGPPWRSRGVRTPERASDNAWHGQCGWHCALEREGTRELEPTSVFIPFTPFQKYETQISCIELENIQERKL
jgi:hypothetical protein